MMKSQIISWMHEYYCLSGVETATKLAEDAADQFQLHSELDDPNSEIWDLAIQVMESVGGY
jgi:hypothetical protein